MADAGETLVVNDSTGGVKGMKNRRYELLPWEQLGQVAELYAAGARKYAENNWRRGYAWSLSYGAAMRHFSQFWEGEELDEETRCHHLCSVVFHALALLYFTEHHESLDDRPHQTVGE